MVICILYVSLWFQVYNKNTSTIIQQISFNKRLSLQVVVGARQQVRFVASAAATSAGQRALFSSLQTPDHGAQSSVAASVRLHLSGYAETADVFERPRRSVA